MSGDNRKYFGTDGIRGIASVPPLDPGTLVLLGKSLGLIFKKKDGHHRILIGKDTRLSGYMIETALAAGITSVGVDVQLVGPLPTPGVAYLTKSMRADAGIVISASHNPFEDNGIKIFAADGNKLPDELELEIEKLLESDGLAAKSAEPAQIGKAQRIHDAVGRFTVYLKGCFPRDYSLEGMRIAIDAGHGAGYIVGPQTLEELGAEVCARGTSPNGRNINAGFGSLFPDIVKTVVADQNCNMGIALDGDGDRAILCDEKGMILDGDIILAICAIDLKEQGLLKNDAVVATVMSNWGLDKMLEPHGIKVFRSSVGDRYVRELMDKEDIILGGEQSGHTIFRDYSTTGDGILTSLKVLEVMLRKGKTLSELAQDFKRFPQRLINVKVSSKPDLETLEGVQNEIKAVEDELKGRGRVLVRYSGTEKKARVMVECENEDDCKSYAYRVAESIEREIGAV
ncbi:MAG: phosphoglucosamine mutase [Bdellovibrionales bacterium]|nr:phosphoglucosamine mutase [Bdellovibrionales bacterium]